MSAELTFSKYPFLAELGLAEDNLGCFDGEWFANGPVYTSINPSTNEPIARVQHGNPDDYERAVKATVAAEKEWRSLPGPRRGEVVRQIGEAMRAKCDALGKLVALEMGKIHKEGVGEVQEVIDMCDYAVGLSRMFAGKIIPSERPGHVLMECWNPIGTLAVITAFNFPVAVFGWNACINLVCGNCQVWKGASSTSLITVATQKIIADVLKAEGLNGAISSCVLGSGSTIGELMINDARFPLVSFTGSTAIGQRISETVHRRFGRTILELGGNNALIVMDDANLDLALRAAVFAAVGTCGQRCTSLRRLLIHENIYDEFLAKVVAAYGTVKLGNPLDDATVVGPLHTKAAVKEYEDGIKEIVADGGKVLVGGKALGTDGGNFVEPTIIETPKDAEVLKKEFFVPIMHVTKFKDIDEAIEINNSVPQGLSSGLFTNHQENIFKWLGPNGSDCGLVNVNVGTSGAEIGGAFGGEKETGGGREAGSDAWKQYMRRSSCTINHSRELPLAQGIKFDI